MKNSFLSVSILLIFTSLVVAQTRMKEDITCKQALELIKERSRDTNFIVLDVRTPEEFKSGHIEKAIMIDYKSADFQDKISKLDKKKSYLVYCRKGGRSAAAIKIMKDLNFNNLYHLYEGILVWMDNGYETEKD
jgi:rhodanese-related sulfurtransferase